MKFPELWERLINEIGSAQITSNLNPGLRPSPFTHYGLVLWVHDGIFDVGVEERGEWNSMMQFTTEDEACEYIYGLLTRKKEEPRLRTPEEEQQSREANAALKRQLDEMFWKRES